MKGEKKERIKEYKFTKVCKRCGRLFNPDLKYNKICWICKGNFGRPKGL